MVRLSHQTAPVDVWFDAKARRRVDYSAAANAAENLMPAMLAPITFSPL
jgi:hypothetical protein